MKKLLLPLLITIYSAANSQSTFFITCPSNIFDTVVNRCSKQITVPNPAYNTQDTSVTITWTMIGATSGSSPSTGKNFVGTKNFNTGGTLIKYMIMKPSGAFDTCSFGVVVREFIPPTITCPPNVTDFTTATKCSKGIAIPNPVVNDNCKVAFLSWKMTGATTLSSPTQGIYVLGTQFYNKGTTTVKYTVTDASGNAVSCTFKVTVRDTLKPIIKCPANVVIGTGVDSCSKSVDIPKISFSDACGVASLAWTMSGATTGASPTTGFNFIGTRVFNKGITTVTYLVKDSSGNSASCTFTVQVIDKQKPVIRNCPDTIKSFVIDGCFKKVTIPDLIFADNCPGSLLNWTMSGATNGAGTGQIGSYAFRIGTTIINDTVRDAAGNYTVCRFRVIVRDTIKPVILCPDSRTDTINNGCSKSITLPNPVFSDNCSKGVSVYWKITGATSLASPFAGINYIGTKTFNAGTSTCYYYIKDGDGNISVCTFKVKVVDLKKPVITCPPEKTDTSANCSKDISVTPPAFSDNCGVTILTWKMTGATTGNSAPSGINLVGTYTFNRGITTITYVAKDASGNYSICKQNVKLEGPVPCQTFARSNKDFIVGLSQKTPLNVRLLSNPANKHFILNFLSTNETQVEINVYSVSGKKVDQLRTNSSRIQFGDNYDKGSYFIEVRKGKERITLTGIKI